MDVTLRILRYDPEHDETPHFESYKVSVDPMDRVLDLLIKVKAAGVCHSGLPVR